MKRRAAISALRSPSAISATTSSSRAVRPAGVLARRRARALADIAGAALAQRRAPRGSWRGGRRGAAARRARRAAHPPSRCARARAPPRRDSRARARSRPPPRAVAVRARGGTAPRRPCGRTGSSIPARRRQSEQLAGGARVAPVERERERERGLRVDRVGLAREPVRLGARRGDRAQALQLADAARELERLVEGRPRVRVAATGAQDADHDERPDAARRRLARIAEHLHRARARRVPAPLVQVRARLVARHVEEPRVEVAVAAVLDPGSELPVRVRVVARRSRLVDARFV